jgi:hypothetical protein
MFLRRTAIGAALIAAPLAFAAPAMAQTDMDFGCAPCDGDMNKDGKNDPVSNEVTLSGPWESGVAAVNGGAWESGVKAVNGGSWENAFPNPEAAE